MDHKIRTIKRGDFSVNTFDHIDEKIRGVNKRPFINFDPYVDTSKFEELHMETCRGIALSSNYRYPQVLGDLPPAFRSSYDFKTFEGLTFEKASEEHIKNMEGMDVQQRRKYMFMFLDGILPWAFTLYLRDGHFLHKTEQDPNYAEWTEDAKHFPKLQEFIKTLPFKSVGRVVFFCTYPNTGVPPHRDFLVKEHNDHNINFFFCRGRKSYVFDPISNEKIYLDPNARSYFFNNRDYHGVDAEKDFRYTLRVDGTFTDEMQEELGLVNGVLE